LRFDEGDSSIRSAPSEAPAVVALTSTGSGCSWTSRLVATAAGTSRTSRMTVSPAGTGNGSKASVVKPSLDTRIV
jgi:hypothetical protein